MENLSEFLREAAVDGKEHTISFARKQIAGGQEGCVVTLKKEIQEPVMADSYGRDHTFFQVKEFTEYLIKQKTDHMLVLGDASDQGIVAVIDESREKGGYEFVQLKPQPHPLFARWENMVSIRTAIKEAATFLLANRRTIVSPDGKELALTMSQIKLSQKVEAYTGIGKHSLNGLIIEEQITGTNPQKTSIELPDEIVISVPICMGSSPVDITFDLLVGSDRDRNVSITFSSPDIEILKVECFEEMLQAVKNNLPDVIVGLGDVDYKQWDYVVDSNDD